MSVKLIIILFIALHAVRVCAQQASFQTFLSEVDKIKRIDSASFGKPFDFFYHKDQYSKFLPQECNCKSENISWQKGCYIECKNFIIVMLQRYCSNYKDENSQWLIENDGTDYVLITYSRSGDIIDYKTVGHSGAAYATRLTAHKNELGLVTEQRILDDCSLLRQYKDLVYTVYTHEYIFNSDGFIEKRRIEGPRKEVVDVQSSVAQFSFEQFQTFFPNWAKPYIDHTVFAHPKNHSELPFDSCLSLLPDTLDYNCWPRDIHWIPCQYIESEDGFVFTLIKECITPKVGFIPYTDYMLLEFHKNGTFKRARNIYHWDDDPTEDATKKNFLITKALKSLSCICKK